jgi:hypothetical protein
MLQYLAMMLLALGLLCGVCAAEQQAGATFALRPRARPQPNLPDVDRAGRAPARNIESAMRTQGSCRQLSRALGP